MLTERGGLHEGFVVAALEWCKDFGEKNNYVFTEYNHASEITADLLEEYDVILQLNYPPYTWSRAGEDAFIKAMEQGRIAWIGFHHASLLGEYDGYPMWDWFSTFLGGIRFDFLLVGCLRPTMEARVDPFHLHIRPFDDPERDGCSALGNALPSPVVDLLLNDIGVR